MSSRFALAIFDMAGTTVQDRGEVPRAFEAALREVGFAIEPSRISEVRGASKRQALAMLLPNAEPAILESIYERFKQLLAEDYRARARPVDGAEETFEECRKRGLMLALNTGFDRDLVEMLLDTLNWSGAMFFSIVCGDDVERGRPAPDLIHAAMARANVSEAGRVVNVGDTVLDLRAGAAAGVGLNVGVLSGAGTRAQLVTIPHARVINSVRELPELLERSE